jgi:hypothetical protein
MISSIDAKEELPLISKSNVWNKERWIERKVEGEGGRNIL